MGMGMGIRASGFEKGGARAGPDSFSHTELGGSGVRQVLLTGAI
jgi:hypothetical protein